MQSEKKRLTMLKEQQLKSSYSKNNEPAVSLQRHLPVSPLLDQFLLNIDQAETISGSTVSNLSFTTDALIENGEEPENIGGNE